MPVIAQAAARIAQKLGNVQFLVAKHPDRPEALYENALRGMPIDYRIAEGNLHNAVGASDFAIVASGTAGGKSGHGCDYMRFLHSRQVPLVFSYGVPG